MEKFIVKAVVVLGLTFSYPAMSGTYSACAGSTCNNGTFNSGNASSGNMGAFSPGFVLGSGMGGGPSAADMAAKEKAEKEGREKGRQECKRAAVKRLDSCNESAKDSHKFVSLGCNIVKWTAIPLGAVSAYSGVNGDAGAAVVVGAGAAAVYQIGEDCQTDTDRVYTAALASCSVKQLDDEITCDAIK